MKLEKIIAIVFAVVALVAAALYFSTEPSQEKFFQLDSDGEIVQQRQSLAPEITSPDGFINTDGGEPITLAELQGDYVVLLDIWTYSCINCQRTLPYLNDWYAKYRDFGLEIVGLHTPEFAFEKKIENVEEAVLKFGIEYPVVLDNDFSTWRALGNRYWPRKYLIDEEGYIVYDHIGEGDYIGTEKQIVAALRKLNQKKGKEFAEAFEKYLLEIELGLPSENSEPIKSTERRSPEIYFGAWRNDRLGNGEPRTEGVVDFAAPNSNEFLSSTVYLDGRWDIQHEYAMNVGAGSIFFDYSAKNVFMVAASADGVTAEIFVDGELIKTIRIQNEQLYDISEHDAHGNHSLEIRLKEGGLEAFTFTFG